MSEGRYDAAIRNITAAREFLVKRKLDSGLARFNKERLDQRQQVCESALSELQGSASEIHGR